MDCPICISFLGENSFELNNCGHEFHPECIMNWLSLRLSCPVCRGPVHAYTFDTFTHTVDFKRGRFDFQAVGICALDRYKASMELADHLSAHFREFVFEADHGGYDWLVVYAYSTDEDGMVYEDDLIDVTNRCNTWLKKNYPNILVTMP